MSIAKHLTDYVSLNVRGKAGYPKDGAYLTASNKLVKLDLTTWDTYEKVQKAQREIRAVFWPTWDGWFGLVDAADDEKDVKSKSLRGAAQRARNLLKEETLPTGKEAIAVLEKALKDHDWTWSMSDSHNVQVRGRGQQRRIQALLNRVPVRTAKRLWKKYAPKGVPYPTTL